MNKKNLVVKELNHGNIGDIMKLQQKIVANLHPDEQHFILHRTEAQYIGFLNGDSSNILGVFDGNELVAQTVYETPSIGENRSIPEFKSDVDNDNLIVFEAILVDPAYRGSSLMKKMLDYIEQNINDNKRTHSIIQIAVDNPASWINALHHGMSITKVDHDPYDGCKVLYLEKKVEKVKSLSARSDRMFSGEVYHLYLGKNIHEKIPALFNKMKYLIEQGYTGIGLNKTTQSLLWIKEIPNIFEMSLLAKRRDQRACL